MRIIILIYDKVENDKIWFGKEMRVDYIREVLHTIDFISFIFPSSINIPKN
jgi:hypothetical protein